MIGVAILYKKKTAEKLATYIPILKIGLVRCFQKRYVHTNGKKIKAKKNIIKIITNKIFLKFN